MKLLIKYTKAVNEESIIIETLNKPIPPFSIWEPNGFPSPININTVTRTPICAITLLLFFIPLLQSNRINPKITGIKAVIDIPVSGIGVFTSINPHNPKIMRIKLLMELILCTFILFFLFNKLTNKIQLNLVFSRH